MSGTKAIRFIGTSVPECPNCGHTLDGAKTVDNGELRQPKADDMSLCINCGTFLVFTEELTLVELTPGDLALLATQYPDTWEHLRKARAIWERMQLGIDNMLN